MGGGEVLMLQNYPFPWTLGNINFELFWSFKLYQTDSLSININICFIFNFENVQITFYFIFYILYFIFYILYFIFFIFILFFILFYYIYILSINYWLF